MSIICDMCGRDINAIGQDNVSFVPGSPLCEDCYNILDAETQAVEFNMNECFEERGYMDE